MNKGERTRAHLLERAAKLIARRGIQNLTARTLAHEAEVSLGLVSHYFPDLSDILFSVVEHIFAVAPLPALKERAPKKQLEDLVKRNFAFFHDNPDYFRCILLSYYYSAFDPRFHKLHARNIAETRKSILRILKQAHHSTPTETASVILDLIEGSLLFTLVEEKDWQTNQRRVLKFVREIFNPK